MKSNFLAIGAVAALATSALVAGAAVELSRPLGDNMVLQAGMEVPVWGTASPGEPVRVSFAGQTQATTAGPDGKWMVRLKPLQYAPGHRPQEMLVSGRDSTLTVRNILVGQVWFCGGQSNATRPAGTTTTARTAISRSANPLLRLCSQKKNYPAKGDPSGCWHEADPRTTPAFSAIGYYFGRELQKKLNTPVGIIFAGVGATKMRQWISTGAAMAEPAYGLKPGDQDPSVGKLFEAYIRPTAPYAVTGFIWYQGEGDAGGYSEFAGRLTALIGDWRRTWGRENLAFLVVQLPPFAERTGHYYPMVWEAQRQVAARVPHVGTIVGLPAMSFHNIHPPNKEPLGRLAALQAMKLAYGRTKVVAEGPTFRSQEIRDGQVILHFDNVGSGLAGFTRHLLGFSIAGSDGKHVPADAVIGPDGAVHVVSAEVADPVSVRYTQSVNGVLDEVELSQQTVEKFLKTAALADVPYFEKRGNGIIIDLDLVGGDRPAQRSTDSTLEGFAIAGEDGVFVEAAARIVGQTVVVSSPNVPHPVGVRYGWYAHAGEQEKQLLPATLYNREGLPAGGFRTDNFNLATRKTPVN